jgi:hypothetical protein
MQVWTFTCLLDFVMCNGLIYKTMTLQHTMKKSRVLQLIL